MPTTTKLRLLRLKYRISLDELAKSGGVSNQQLSRLELGQAQDTVRKEQMVWVALRTVIARRRAALDELEQECAAYQGRLLQQVEVGSDGV